MVSFKWLKDQKLLREGSRPRCQITDEIVPNFREENVDVSLLAQFSEEGVFTHEQSYYRPSVYCVDGRLDKEEERLRGRQPSYITLLTCQERAEDRMSCQGAEASSCPVRCCQPWQAWLPQSGHCVYSKSRRLQR